MCRGIRRSNAIRSLKRPTDEPRLFSRQTGRFVDRGHGSDPGDRLRRELKYVSTPLLLLLNDSLQITDIYKPAAGTESAAERFRTAAVRTRQSR